MSGKIATAAMAAMLSAAIIGWVPVVEGGSQALVPYKVRGDAIPQPLDGKRGDAARGREIAIDRRIGNCVACHVLPEPDVSFQGEIGPRLAGVGRRLSEGQIRLRVVDQARVNKETVMPSYYKIDGLNNVAPAYRGRPVLTAAQIEDVVAYLVSLRQ